MDFDDDESLYDDDPMEGLGGDDEFGDPYSSEPSKNRNPIERVKSGAMQALKDPITYQQASSIIARNALPEGYGAAVDGFRETASAASDIYDKTLEALKQPVKEAKSLLNKSAKLATFLPESIRDKVIAATAEEEEGSGYSSPTQAELDESAIAATIRETFAAEREANNEERKVDNDYRDKEEKKSEAQYKVSSNLLASIAESQAKMVSYKHEIEINYQRKMLELSQRKFFILRDLLSNSIAYHKDSLANLSAITQNTSYPDVIKMKMSEKFGDVMRERFFGNAAESLSTFVGNFADNLKKNIESYVVNTVNSAADMTSMISQAGGQFLDMADNPEMAEMMDPLEMGSELGVQELMDYGAGKLGRYLAPKLAKYGSIRDLNSTIMYLKDSYPELLSEWAKGSSDMGLSDLLAKKLPEEMDGQTRDFILNTVDVMEGPMSNFIKSLIPKFHQGGNDILSNFENIAGEAATFDEMTRKSIIEIIPGYLARMLQQMETIANGSPAEMMVYSTGKEMFIRKSEAVADLRGSLYNQDKEQMTVRYALDVVDKLDPNKVLSPTTRVLFARKMIADKANGLAFTIERYQDLTDEDFLGGADVSALLKEVFYDKETGKYKKNALELRRQVAGGLNYALNDQLRDRQNIYNQMNKFGGKEIGLAEGSLVMKHGKIVVNNEYAKGRMDKAFETAKAMEYATTGRYTYTDPIGEARSGFAASSAGSFGAGGGSFFSGPGGDNGGFDGVNFRLDNILEQLKNMPLNFRSSLFERINDKLGIPVHVMSGLTDNGEVTDTENPLEELVKNGFATSNELLAKILEAEMAHGAMTAAGVAGYRVELSPSALVRGMFSMGKGAMTATGSVWAKWNRFLLGGIKRGSGPLGSLISGAAGMVSGTAGYLFGSKSELAGATMDLYRKGDRDPVLRAVDMVQGKYKDAKGNLVTSVDKISGAVYDLEGNILLTDEEVAAGLYNVEGKKIPVGNRGRLFGRLLSGGAGGMASAWGKQLGFMGTILGSGFNMVKRVTGWLNRAQDVYVAGETTPRLLAKVLENGGYYSSKTGRPIYTIADMDSDILDSEKRVVLSLDDARKGLVNVYGNKFTGLNILDRALGRVTQALGVFKSIGKLSMKLGGKAVGAGGTVLKRTATGAGKVISGITGRRDIAEIITANSEQVSTTNTWLEKIFTLLADFTDGKKYSPGGGSGGGSGGGGSGGDGGAAMKEYAEKTKETVSDLFSSISEKASKAYKDGVEMANKAAAAVKDEYENGMGKDLRERASNLGNDLSDAYDKASKVVVDKTEEFRNSEMYKKASSKVDEAKEYASGKYEQFSNSETGKKISSSVDSVKEEVSKKIDEVSKEISELADKLDKELSENEKIGEHYTDLKVKVGDAKDQAAAFVADARKMAVDAYDNREKHLNNLETHYLDIKNQVVKYTQDLYKDMSSKGKDSIESQTEEVKAVAKEAIYSFTGKTRSTNGSFLTEVKSDKAAREGEKAKSVFDSDGDGDRDGSWQDLRDKEKENKKGEEKPTVIIGERHEEKKGWLGALLGFLGVGILKIVGSVKSLGGMLKNLLNLKNIANVLKGVLGSPLKTTGKIIKGAAGLAWKGTKLLARGALSAGRFLLGGVGTAARLAGTAVAAVGGAPAVLAAAAIGGAAYGGYKLYRHYKKGKPAKPIESLRFMQYGIDPKDQEGMRPIRNLEEAIADDIEWKDNEPKMTKSIKHYTEEYAEDFGVNVKDPEQMAQWANWFGKRFIPVYLTHLSTAKGMGIGKDVEDIDSDLNDDNRNEYLKATTSSSGVPLDGALSVNISPFPDKPLFNSSSSPAEMTETMMRKKNASAQPAAIHNKRGKLKVVPANNPPETKEVKPVVHAPGADVSDAAVEVASSGIDKKIPTVRRSVVPTSSTSDVSKAKIGALVNKNSENNNLSGIDSTAATLLRMEQFNILASKQQAEQLKINKELLGIIQVVADSYLKDIGEDPSVLLAGISTKAPDVSDTDDKKQTGRVSASVSNKQRTVTPPVSMSRSK